MDISVLTPSFIESTALSTLISSVLVWLIFLYAIRAQNFQKYKKIKLALFATVGFFGWFSVVYALGKMSFFAKIPLFAPNMVLGFLFLSIVLKSLYDSKTMQAIAQAMPMHMVIGVQTLRVGGYVFFTLYAMNLLPAAFAFPAGIGDIIVGLSAPLVALLYFLKKRYAVRIAIIWNVVGILDLVVAIGVGILAYPRPAQILPILPTAVSTDILSLFPMVLIPLFAVPLGFFLHFLSLRILLKKGGEIV